MSAAESPEYFTVEHYLAQEELAEARSEYIDGWIRAMSGASLRHGVISGNCYFRLREQLREHACQPFHSETKLRIHTPKMKRFYYPDVQVVCDSNAPSSVFQERPVLIIEVLSPSTRRYDLDEKMTAYLGIPTLDCFIALEQHQPIAIVMRRTSGGFLREQIEGVDNAIALPFLGFALRMQDIYERVVFTPECVQEEIASYEANDEVQSAR